LEVVAPSGKRRVFGDGTGTPVTGRFTDRAAIRELVLDPYLALGELFMDERLVVEQGSIYDLLYLFQSNLQGMTVPGFGVRLHGFVRYSLRRLKQFNPARRAQRNVAHHYDLDARLYSLFLDNDRQYSCAYFETPDATIDDAQLAKRRHITAKLLVEPGQSVLDIGCGWGGLGLYLAATAGAKVTGITLSKEQLAIAQGRAIERNLADRAEFRLEDYRATPGQFDRIVSVGMFEHVGVVHYETFFRHAAALLKDDGVMLLHAIGRSDPPAFTNPWIEKYIFPGGYTPALSEVLPVIERAGLIATDIEILRLHYAETLKAWRERFLARRDEALALYDERFCRMWEFYLAGCETSFRFDRLMVFQIQLAHQIDAVPITRDYIARREAALRNRESAPPPLRLAGE
jgi:cyclopropane-fatty-acyl-phospholipid synthase